ncbi:hypothetical protein [Candidatus Palauibacter sp.]|uniref:hypothetical protein n=1 Tax=Candidatus Palauibacter sp. TaxID=3101350 RepID=UPI003B01F894
MKKIDRRTAKRYLWVVAIGMVLLPIIPFTIFLIQVGDVSGREGFVQLALNVVPLYKIATTVAFMGGVLMVVLVCARLLGWSSPPTRRSGVVGGLMTLAILMGLSMVPVEAPVSVAGVPLLGAAELCAQEDVGDCIDDTFDGSCGAFIDCGTPLACIIQGGRCLRDLADCIPGGGGGGPPPEREHRTGPCCD